MLGCWSKQQERRMNYKLVIFDWEGTLGDTLGQTMIPGAEACLTQLHQLGIMLAIATNKRDTLLQRDLIFFGLTSLFQVTRSANRTAPKPDPQMLLEILQETGVEPESALMIGDSESDMAMAHAIGIKAIGIDLSGQYGASLQTAGASHVVRDYEALMQYLDLRMQT
jgi:phosphoglycolate phosphatase